MPHRLGLEGAQNVATKPLSRRLCAEIHGVKGRNEGQEIADEEKEATDQTQALDDEITV